MCQEKLKKKNYECISDNSCNSIRRKKTNKKIIMTKQQQQLIYGSCIYQTTYYWWPQARMGVFYCVCKSSFRILKRVLWDRVLRWTKVCWCMWVNEGYILLHILSEPSMKHGQVEFDPFLPRQNMP